MQTAYFSRVSIIFAWWSAQLPTGLWPAQPTASSFGLASTGLLDALRLCCAELPSGSRLGAGSHLEFRALLVRQLGNATPTSEHKKVSVVGKMNYAGAIVASAARLLGFPLREAISAVFADTKRAGFWAVAESTIPI